MTFDNILFHCSSLGYIMTDPREKSNREKYDELVEKRGPAKERYEKLEKEYDEIKNKETLTANRKFDTMVNAGKKYYKILEDINILEPIKDVKELSDTCKNHLMDIFVSVKYDRTRDIKSKYLEKGKLLEEDAITVYSRLMKFYHEKNIQVKNNEVIVGEIDALNEDSLMIYDTKVPWDIFTFWRSFAKPLDPLYYWQAQGYMWLWEKEIAKVVKVLLDTPKKLIEDEKKNLLRTFIGSEYEYEQACKELEKNMVYDDIPIEERVIEFVVQRNDEDISRIKSRVIECREFLNNIKPGSYYGMAY